MSILITGANRGIGRALFDSYLADGADVVGTLRQGTPLSGRWMPLDVTDAASHRALAERMRGEPLDLLVCNAGIFLDRGQSLNTGYPAAMWAETFAVNVTGVFLSVQTLLANLRLSSAPRIAIVASQMGSHERAAGGAYIYRASKAAAVSLGRNLAADLRAEGIAVGIYHPGWVQTDMGGGTAALTAAEAAAGLKARFAELSVDTTGRFLNWDGTVHPF